MGGALNMSASGGAGNDRIDFGALDPCMLPESETRIGLFGNDGHDVIDISLTDAEIEGLFSLAVLGGEGNDVLDSFIVPCLLPAGRANLLFDGGQGDDRIAIRIEMDDDSQDSELAAVVFGGLGDDDLTLGIFGGEHLRLLTALVDGGRGFDMAQVTDEVRVINCEEVSNLDEPR
jgi:hypothetical protein